ncbi:MAG TPA: cellulose synthase family protein [Acidobacteriota bacterium]|nr:cellulose synthase family protein [Acidobacteriota bacterium]
MIDWIATDPATFLHGHPGLSTSILAAYFLVLCILSIYGLHRYQLVYLHHKYRHRVPKPEGRLDKQPRVTVQLPLYNEVYVVERLIDAVCRLDYPRHLLEIQVLDDSDDETRQVARRRVRHYAAKGFDIHYLRRPDREGFKAGALHYGLKKAKGEFIAIFDADFVPHPDTLQRTLDYFSDSQVGMVQVRWDHINGDYSLLTKVQSILLDGHFVLESATRHRSGRFFNFNGTAGIWRRQAIEEAGSWQHDTLTEDLDLSYRAQLKGWKFVFISDFTAPAEIPVDVNSFKSQQYRWAKGSIQTARKLLPRLLRSRLPARLKVEAFYHLTANVCYPLMVLLSLLLFPALIIRVQHGWLELVLIDLPLFAAATFSVSSFYVVSQRAVHRDWLSRLRYLPMVLSTGIGLSVNNAKAVMEGLLGIDSEFIRTPKFSIRQSGDRWTDKRYRARIGLAPLIEITLGLLFAGVIFYAFNHGHYASLPFLILFMNGFLYIGALSLWQPLQNLRQALLRRAAATPQPSR